MISLVWKFCHMELWEQTVRLMDALGIGLLTVDDRHAVKAEARF